MFVTGKRVEPWALENGFTKSTVYLVMASKATKGKSVKKVRKAISSAVNFSETDLWPEEKQE